MSRYVKQLPSGGQVAYGYDRMLNEYFIEEFKAPGTFTDEEDEVVFSIGTNFNTTKPLTPGKYTHSNGELLEVYMRYKGIIPQQHIDAVAMDIPF